MGPDTTFRLCVLASGSRGNSIYLRAGDMECLIDAGLSGEAIESRLESIGTSAGRIRHVFITHEHSDHISALRGLARKYTFTVHTNANTYLQIASLVRKRADIRIFDGPFTLDGVDVRPFPVSHDAVDPVGFSFIFRGRKVSLVTDLGQTTQAVAEGIRESEIIVLETNHDPGMLMRGSYPWILKRRIAGPTGHLSNQQACELLSHVWSDRVRHVCLAHLSQENNTPETARQTIDRHLDTLLGPGPRPTVHLTYQDRPAEVISMF